MIPILANLGFTNAANEDDVNKRTDLTKVKARDKDFSTGKKIAYIVYQSKTFLVSIDSALNLNWTTTKEYGDYNYAADFGEVVGSCNMADALVDRIFIGKRNRMAYKKMLGEVIGRVLDDKKSDSAKKLLVIVDQRLGEHCKERVRMAYIAYAFSTVALLGIVTGLVVWFRPDLDFLTVDPKRYRILLATFLGGIGAFITTFFRFRSYTGSVVAGLPIHRLDGFLRIFYGLVAGLIITLAIKGNVLMGFANSSELSQPWLGYFLAMIGGASEVLIPNLIKDTEKNLGVTIKKEKEEKVAPPVKDDKNTPPTAADAAKKKSDAAVNTDAAKNAGQTEGDKTKIVPGSTTNEATGSEGIQEQTDAKAAITQTGNTTKEGITSEHVPTTTPAKPIEIDVVLTPKDSFSPAQSGNL